jgi:histidinol-phosphatase (PHP family)
MEIISGEEYVRTIRRLAERYSDKIHISVGFEMEYYPSFFNDMMNVVRGLDVDYLILGQHFIGDEWPNGIGSRGYTEDTRLLSEYVDNVVLAIKSGAFSYVAHPDIVNFDGSEGDYVREMTRLCLAAKENDVPLEINLHGLANKRHYPTQRFWKIAGEVGAPVTFGYDVHDSSSLLNHAVVKEASRFIKDFGLNYIGMPRLRAIK